jgi:hypothetical protein
MRVCRRAPQLLPEPAPTPRHDPSNETAADQPLPRCLCALPTTSRPGKPLPSPRSVDPTRRPRWRFVAPCVCRKPTRLPPAPTRDPAARPCAQPLIGATGTEQTRVAARTGDDIDATSAQLAQVGPRRGVRKLQGRDFQRRRLRISGFCVARWLALKSIPFQNTAIPSVRSPTAIRCAASRANACHSAGDFTPTCLPQRTTSPTETPRTRAKAVRLSART